MQAVEHIKSAAKGGAAHLIVNFKDTVNNPKLCSFYWSMGFKNRRDERGGYFCLAPLHDHYAAPLLTAPKGSTLCNTDDGFRVELQDERNDGSQSSGSTCSPVSQHRGTLTSQTNTPGRRLAAGQAVVSPDGAIHAQRRAHHPAPPTAPARSALAGAALAEIPAAGAVAAAGPSGSTQRSLRWRRSRRPRAAPLGDVGAIMRLRRRRQRAARAVS